MARRQWQPALGDWRRPGAPPVGVGYGKVGRGTSHGRGHERDTAEGLVKIYRSAMDRAQLTTMFDYLYWLRDTVLAAASKLPEDVFQSPETVTTRDLRGTLVHELDVEWSWRLRLQGGSGDHGEGELEPSAFPSLASLAERWRRDESEMRAWLATLTDGELATTPPIEPARYPLWVYPMHIVAHGITELSDAAVLLRRAGQPTGDLGFLNYWDDHVKAG